VLSSQLPITSHVLINVDIRQAAPMTSSARFVVLGAASLLLSVPVLSAVVNEEAAHRLDAMTGAETEAVQNMTVESSLHILQGIEGLHPHVVSFIQESLGSHHHRHHHKRGGHHLRHQTQQVHRAADRTVPAAYAGVKQAVKGVSTSIQDASKKWEVENARCCAEYASSKEMLETLDEGIALANGQASAAQGEILKANKKIAEDENNIPGEKDSLHLLHEQCGNDKMSMEKDLEITFDNLGSLDNMEMTSCDAPKSALLQCEHPKSGESFLMLRHHTMRQSADQWKHPSVQRFLTELLSSSEQLDERPTVFLQMEQHTDPNKCTMQANPECQQIRDRYLLMTSDLEDNIDELKENLKHNENDCEHNTDSIEENVKNADQNLKQMQTALAEATADYNTAMEASRLKNEERSGHLTTMKTQAKQCADNKNQLITEKTGLLKIRGEMLSMQGIKVFIQDCKVSAWIPGECSKPCGGGMRMLTRDIMTPPVLDGAPCPLLKAEEKCNTEKCPVNCEMGEWGGWSACSAKCGGGVYERVRDINRHAAHGGNPCGSAQETQSCNPQSCDKNCALRKWSKWSECSKACDTGTTFRVRAVQSPADGQGTCPDKLDKKRMHSESCNTQPCLAKKEDKDKKLQCDSKRDVVLLIDGSASLRSSGWDATKIAAAAIVNAMGKEVNVATLLFSGPKTRKDYFKCSGQLWPNRTSGTNLGTPNMETDCLVRWVDHFSEDKVAVVNNLKSMEWPRGSTLTSEGLAMAETELDGGRRDAEAVVIVLTDGKPMNKRKVSTTVERLRRKARLMWVAVTDNAPVSLIKQWASVPWQENLIAVPDFEALQSKDTVNKIVANMCPTLELV